MFFMENRWLNKPTAGSALTLCSGPAQPGAHAPGPGQSRREATRSSVITPIHRQAQAGLTLTLCVRLKIQEPVLTG